jgi:DNA modification methylase
MTVYLQDPDVTLYHGDALEVLKTLPSESVHCCVTSPPFYGLRDYQTGRWEGGEAECDHEGSERWYTESTAAVSAADAFSEPGEANAARLRKGRWREKGDCVKCGARRVDEQIGLEETPELWIERLVEVFREVKRVQRRDGTLWLEIGDSYSASISGSIGQRGAAARQSHIDGGSGRAMDKSRIPGLKPKDLIGAPWMLAFALRADGWYLRSDIVWSRPNPMPESVTDRPTKSHSYVFLLTRSPRYFFDQEAVREPHESDGRGGFSNKETAKWAHGVMPDGSPLTSQVNAIVNPNGRNIRSVWTIPTQPYPEAHFATFPEELARRCIAAGSREGDVILDCFVGSGTVCYVARKLGRRAIGIDLNAEYLELAAERLQQQSLFARA